MQMKSKSKGIFKINLSALKNIRKYSKGKVKSITKLYMIAVVNSLLNRIQLAIYSDKIKPPDNITFILGHWRSGTTFLHELLSADPATTFPNTYECMNPNHFLLTEKQFIRTHKKQVKRPMDDVVVSLLSPQEDEFALMCLGALSPYLIMILPRELELFLYTLSHDRWDDSQIHRWLNIFKTFISGVNFMRPGRMLLKSPTHSFRIDILSDFNPNFILIVRNPDYIFTSTVRMWKSMFDMYALQDYDDINLHEFVINIGEKYIKHIKKLRKIDKNRVYIVRYEDIVSNAPEYIEDIYNHFGWDKDGIKYVISKWEKMKGYKARSEPPPTNIIEIIRERWSEMYSMWKTKGLS